MRGTRLAGTALMLLAAVAAGCSGRPQGTGTGPFTPPPCTGPDCGTSWVKGETVTHRIYDVEILNLHNYSRRAVRLTAVRMIHPSAGIRTVNVRAFLLSQTQGGAAIDEGDLAKLCPESYRPHPVTDVAVRPGKDSNWVVIVEFVFERPGRYHFGLAKLSYVTGGQSGWQYFPLPDIRVKTVPVNAYPSLYQATPCGPQ